jgi:ankyrin repeat protein
MGVTHPEELDRVLLYYAVLCGIHGLVERLLTAHLQDLDANGGNWGSPLNAALANGHLDIAKFLLDRSAVGDTMGSIEWTGLYITSTDGCTDIVGSLIDHGVNLNTRCKEWNMDSEWTLLHAAIDNDHPDITLLLLKGGANPETPTSKHQTALCMTSSRRHANVI